MIHYLPSPAMVTERIRTTISLTPEALAVFKRMADAGNMSVSRCMGDWLIDTLDAAEMITAKMEDAKVAPMRVLKEMRALVSGLGDAVMDSEKDVRQRRAEGRNGTGRGADAPLPPPSNTGVLVPPQSTAKSTRPKSKNWRVV